MVAYKLCYFPVRGKGELIRLIFHYAGVEFEDCQIPLADWPSRKSEMPTGKMPVLYVDGVPYAQSLSIARYLAEEFGLLPSETLDKLRCNEYVDYIWLDVYGAMYPMIIALAYKQDQSTADQELTKLKRGVLKSFHEHFESILSASNSGYLIGEKLTLADLALAELTSRIVACFDADALKNYPKLAKHTAMVHDLPKIKNYVESRQNMPL